MWAPVAPLLVFAMLGVVAVGYAVLWALVTGLAELVKLVLIWGPSAVKERFRFVSVSSCTSFHRIDSIHRATEPRDTLPLQRVVTMAALILAVVFFAPYQFAFLVLVLVHLFSTVRCLLLAQDASASSSPSSDTVGAPRSAAVPAAAARRVWARYHYSFSILFVLVTLLPINALILVVWVRNLAVGWLAPFSSDHNVLLLVGYLANVEALHGGRMLKAVESGSSRRCAFLLPSPRSVCSNTDRTFVFAQEERCRSSHYHSHNLPRHLFPCLRHPLSPPPLPFRQRRHALLSDQGDVHPSFGWNSACGIVDRRGSSGWKEEDERTS